MVYRQILERLQAAPGVAAAGAARVTVLSGGARTVSVSLDGQRIREDARQQPRRPAQRHQRRLPAGARHPDPARPRLHARRMAQHHARGDRQPVARGAIVARPGSARQDDRRRRTPANGGRAWSRTRSTAARSSAKRRRSTTCRWRRTTKPAWRLHVRTADGDPLALLPAVRSGRPRRRSARRGGAAATAARGVRPVDRRASG